MQKTEVYSWRLSPELKIALETEARRRGESLAELLERVSHEWLAAQRESLQDEEAEQARRHAAAARAIGTIDGGDPGRSERVREDVRRRLTRRRAR